MRRLRGLQPIGRLPLTIAVGATGTFGARAGGPSREETAEDVSRAYDRPLDEVLDIPLAGEPAEVADQLAHDAEAGAHHVVVGLAGDGWRAQCTALAQIRTLLRT